jgi:malate dehydrogenase (oxaloacetate-decarboxylating)
MKLAAAEAIAECVPDSKLSVEYIIPSLLDRTVASAVAAAVAKAARESGVANA